MNLLPFSEMNCLHLGDCVGGMRGLPDGCIPLTVTSPPYDNLRQYGNHPFDFEAVARELGGCRTSPDVLRAAARGVKSQPNRWLSKK